MNAQREFFSANHKRLLSIAVWAKYLAWIALVIYILWGIGTYFQEQNYFLYYSATGRLTPGQTAGDFIQFLRQAPSFGFSILVEIIYILLRGIVWFCVLKGISLGLNMIVETDINYRERKNMEVGREQ